MKGICGLQTGRMMLGIVLLGLGPAARRGMAAKAVGTGDVRPLLFDFESGVRGWVGNPWGGGASGAAADGHAAYGRGCLRAWFKDVKRGATVISPDFPKNAAWRTGRWGGISLYVRGDGSNGTFRLHLDSLPPQGLVWSRTLSLEDRAWHRVYLPFSTFWNRQGKRLDPSRIRRIYFGGTGTHEFWVDQVRLEPPQRVVGLEGARSAPAPGTYSPVLLDLGGGRFAVRLDTCGLSIPARGLVLEGRLRSAGREWQARDAASAADAHRRGLFALFPERLSREGTATVELAVRSGDGALLGKEAGRFPVFLPRKPRDTLSVPVVPAPKRVVPGKGYYAPARPMLLYVGGRAPRLDAALRLLDTALVREYGLRVQRFSEAGPADIRLFLAGNGGANAPPECVRLLNTIPPEGRGEGYVLRIRRTGIDLAAGTAHGLYDGLQTLLQLFRSDSPAADRVRVRCLTVVDWPSLAWRALTLDLPTDRWGYPNNARVDSAFFCDFVRRFVARHKFNAVVLGINAGYRYKSHPEIAGPAAWSRRDLERFVQTCRDNFIEPIPFVNSYGHTGWLTLRHPELREDGDLNTLCVKHPESFRILTDLYAELLDVFHPVRFFHIGMDEVRWKTLKVPAAKRCKLCAGVPKYELFAGQVRRLHDWLAARGVRTMMWGDMLLPEHNGGPPFHTAQALPLLPRDILMANWSTSLAPNSNQRFHQLGFTVWQSNSRGVNRAQARWCAGNMFGVWNKMPWWGDAPWRSGQWFNFLSFPVAAQYSWNLWPDVDTLQPALRRTSLLLPGWVWDGVDPDPAGSSRRFPLHPAPNWSSRGQAPAAPEHWFGADPAHELRFLPRGTVRILGIPFDILDAPLDCVRAPENGAVAAFPVNRRVAELRFLHTAYVPAKRQKALDDAFKRPENWPGIPIGEYRIEYADGSRAVLPIRYIANIGRWDSCGKIPWIYHSAGFLRAKTGAARKRGEQAESDICLYVAQWVNPHPEKPVARVGFSAPPGAPAIPVLFAATGVAPRRP